jgi:hypothetical protein
MYLPVLVPCVTPAAVCEKTHPARNRFTRHRRTNASLNRGTNGAHTEEAGWPASESVRSTIRFTPDCLIVAARASIALASPPSYRSVTRTRFVFVGFSN